jgi:molybdate transport system substrate-binding protein
MKLARFFALLLFLAISPGLLFAQELKVAAASDLTAALKEVATKFEGKTGKKVQVTFGSSGNFFTQIQNGAPFDLFFSADITYAQKLEDAGLAEKGSLYEYAVGRLVLWAPKQSSIDISKGFTVLSTSAVHKLAIANPQHAPYGRAAVAALEREKIYDSVKPKIVFGENISQTAQFVQSGNADVGLIALSLALSPQMKDSGKYWLVPEDFHPPLRQAVVVLKSASDKSGAEAFLTFLKSSEGRTIMERFGFKVPTSAP